MNKAKAQAECDDYLDEKVVAELLRALADSRKDLAAGRFVVESPVEHVARISQISNEVNDHASKHFE